MPMPKRNLTSRQCADVLRAIAGETRLLIIESLLAREKCVSALVQETRRRQPHVSHHLRILRDAGLVEGLRDGKRICYRVSPRLQRAFKQSRRQALDLGCCLISFPQSILNPASRE